MLIHSASQLLTLAGGPQRGQVLGRLGLLEDGAVLVRGETIEDVGQEGWIVGGVGLEPVNFILETVGSLGKGRIEQEDSENKGQDQFLIK